MLDIQHNGLVQRFDNGNVVILRPGKNGTGSTELEVPEHLADTYRLASGDIVEGETEPLDDVPTASSGSPELWEDLDTGLYDERDEPGAARGITIPAWLTQRGVPVARLTAIRRVNGLDADHALDRPTARRRSRSERTRPDVWLPLATGPNDTTGRMLDFAALLTRGDAGMIAGPHGAGLTRTLRSVVGGITKNAPEIVPLVLLTRARGEEITDWRRRFPGADILVCPPTTGGATAEQTLRLADLALACAQRQTECGRHVLLAVDSLTGLWAALLEHEQADAQKDADQSKARQRLREWVQTAGNFGGEAPLGGHLGGSLTLVGTVWEQPVDPDAEEEQDVHPHLRLPEHLLHETGWRIRLSPELAALRFYPALDTAHCLSRHEEYVVPEVEYESLLRARASLSASDTLARYNALMDALDATATLPELEQALTPAG